MKKDIVILSNDFNLLGIIDDYDTIIFHRKFYSVGEFELHVNVNQRYIKLLEKENLILLDNQFNKVGIILHKEINLNEDGLEILTVKGYTLKGLLSRRIIEPKTNGYDRQEGNQERIMKQFVKNNTIDTSPNRVIKQIEIAENKELGKNDKWRSRYENLAIKLEEIGKYSKLGWDLILNLERQKFIFDVYQGRNLTSTQSINSPVIFSVDYENIKGHSYVDSNLNYKNVIYAAGNGEEDNRLIQQVGNSKGIERVEHFEDVSQAHDIDELKEDGKRVLEQFNTVNNFESEVIDFGSFKLGRDYDLGDYVTIQHKKWNLIKNAQIVEIIETINIDGYNIDLIFGNSITTFIDRLKNIEETQKKR